MKRILISIAIISLILIVGCGENSTSDKDKSKCSNMCDKARLDYGYVDSFVNGGPRCVCRIPVRDIDKALRELEEKQFDKCVGLLRDE